MVTLRLATSCDIDATECELEVSFAGLVVLRFNEGAAASELPDLILSLSEILQDLCAFVECHEGELSVAQMRLEVLQNASAVWQVSKKSPKSLIYFFQREVLHLAPPAALRRSSSRQILL